MSTDTRQALTALFDAWASEPENAALFTGKMSSVAAPFYARLWAAGYRAALSAQPVEGAVAIDLPDDRIMGIARRWGLGNASDTAKFFAREIIAAADTLLRAKFAEAVSAQAAPAPEPSAQAVAHPSHQTVREWMPVSEALRLSDLWTAGDLDNCGQWRAAIKVLADEVRALAASPQPEPSAQGEPVAWVEPACHGNGGCCHDDKCEKWTPLASAPSTPPPAVGEAVPLNFDQLQKVMSKHFGGRELTDDEADSAEAFARAIERAHGIAPKAAQEKT